MLPAAPKDVGRLSDVLVSAAAAMGLGGANRLRLPKVSSAIVVLVDGLGYENLTTANGYARFLNSLKIDSIRCEFPSTTATSLTGLATGKRSGAHGIIGYSIFDRLASRVRNLLTGWSSREEAGEFRKALPLSLQLGKSVTVVGPGAYEDTGFTELTMAGAAYSAVDDVPSRFAKALNLAASAGNLIYLYVPELDQYAHRFGVESDNWLHGLESLDRDLKTFIEKVPGNVGVIITADHGVLDVPNGNHIYLDEYSWYTEAVSLTTGDPRCNFLYLDVDQSLTNLRGELTMAFGEQAYVVTQDELIAAGWLFEEVVDQSNYQPDLYLIWQGNCVGYDRRTAKPQHLKMIGQHGAISDRETRIPLIRAGGF